MKINQHFLWNVIFISENRLPLSTIVLEENDVKFDFEEEPKLIFMLPLLCYVDTRTKVTPKL